MVKDIWEQLLAIVKQDAGSRVVETWLKAIMLKRWDAHEQVIYLQAPNQFVQQWVCSHYMPLLERHLARLLNIDRIKIVFLESNQITLDQQKEYVQENRDSSVQTEPAAILSVGQREKSFSTSNALVKAGPAAGHGHIKQTYVFDTFVVGPSNSLAHAAAHAVTEKPGYLYNPLFLYGNSGLGKTHLLYAIGNRIQQLNRNALVLYQTADRFVNEFIHAIRFDRVHKFQEKYKKVDVLLIDDIQFISNKEQTQEAFFHIFNALYDMHKQIVFSSDTVPKGIEGLAERLRSRLEWGLVADIQLPTIETKIAILKKKAELNNELLDDDVAYFIASRVISNIRELEGSLIRVCAFARLTNQPISLELAKKVLVRTGAHEVKKTIGLEQIAKKVCDFYSYSVAELRSSKRSKDLSFARHVAMYFMKKMTIHSLQEIGLFWGRKDHSTVMHAVGKIDRMRTVDSDLNRQLSLLEQEINQS